MAYTLDIKKLNDLMIYVVNTKIKEEDNIALLFSGGLDSRLILSYLLILGYKPICYTFDNGCDILVSKEICNDYNLNHIIFEYARKDHVDTIDLLVHSITKKYDCIFSGMFFNEIWEWNQWIKPINKLNKLYRVATFINVIEKYDNLYSPCINKNVVKYILGLKSRYRKNRILQKKLIKIINPDMLKYKIRKIN